MNHWELHGEKGMKDVEIVKILEETMAHTDGLVYLRFKKICEYIESLEERLETAIEERNRFEEYTEELRVSFEEKSDKLSTIHEEINKLMDTLTKE